jgi:hypothetical protein
MECRINHQIDYLDLPRTLQQQREMVFEKIKLISSSHVVLPGCDTVDSQCTVYVCVRVVVGGGSGGGDDAVVAMLLVIPFSFLCTQSPLSPPRFRFLTPLPSSLPSFPPPSAPSLSLSSSSFPRLS